MSKVIIKDRLATPLMYYESFECWCSDINQAYQFTSSSQLSRVMEQLKNAGYKNVEVIEYHG